jgi:hypothetical protein
MRNAAFYHPVRSCLRVFQNIPYKSLVAKQQGRDRGVETSKIKAKACKTQYNDKINNQHLICMFILQVIICIYLSLQEIKQTFV